jgi:hypothetical protein
MTRVETLRDLKEKVQAGFDNNEETLKRFGKTYSTQLKAYLMETNCRDVGDIGCPHGIWRPLDASGWYANENPENPDESDTLFLNKTSPRVLKIYSLLDALTSDYLMDSWVKKKRGMDYCWLTRGLLLHWANRPDWEERGTGLRFNDGLTPEVDAGNFSMKAWHGANVFLHGIDEVLAKAKDLFAITSVRWQKRSAGDVAISAEWYSNGKVTFNRAADVDEVLSVVSEMAIQYEEELKLATKFRDTKMTAFEIDFTTKIDLDRFSEVVSKGVGEMRLWLVETESQPDFRRFRGVDLHNWDRIFLDIGSDFAFLTIPGEGCVNAAPRLATIQGEDNAGKTRIYFDGVDVFGNR